MEPRRYLPMALDDDWGMDQLENRELTQSTSKALIRTCKSHLSIHLILQSIHYLRQEKKDTPQ